MLFTNKRGDYDMQIKVHDNSLVQKNECKFLGIMIDSQLNWKSHINYISSKISKNIAILKFLKFTFPKEILKTLYLSLVLPYFNYCNIVWGAADKSLLEPLVVLQKKSLRIINKVNYLDHTDPLFLEMKLLKLCQIYKLNCLLFIYKCINMKQFVKFRNRLVRVTDIHNHYVRSGNQFRPPACRLKKVRQSYFYNGIILWNELDPEVYDCKTIYYFKRTIKEDFFVF